MSTPEKAIPDTIRVAINTPSFLTLLLADLIAKKAELPAQQRAVVPIENSFCSECLNGLKSA